MEGSVDRCIKCGSCQRVCPVLGRTSSEVFPGPRTVAVDVPRGPHPQVLREVLWNCSLCEACRYACPSRVELPRAMQQLRRRFLDPRTVSPGHARLLANIDNHGISVEPANNKRTFFDEKADICYFPGCIAQERAPETVQAALALIRASGSKVTIPSGLVCCGSPLRKIGDQARAERCVQRNLEVLSRFQRIVTSCPGCTTELASQYGLDVMHIVEFLTEGQGRGMPFQTSPRKRVALHAACHLERGVGPHTTEESWLLIGSLPGVIGVELEDTSVCCGAGGGLRSGNPPVASALAARKMQSAQLAGADVLVAACPFCVANLRGRGEVQVQELGHLLCSYLAKPGQR